MSAPTANLPLALTVAVVIRLPPKPEPVTVMWFEVVVRRVQESATP